MEGLKDTWFAYLWKYLLGIYPLYSGYKGLTKKGLSDIRFDKTSSDFLDDYVMSFTNWDIRFGTSTGRPAGA